MAASDLGADLVGLWVLCGAVGGCRRRWGAAAAEGARGLVVSAAAAGERGVIGAALLHLSGERWILIGFLTRGR